MTLQQKQTLSNRINAAVHELELIILDRFPDATFHIEISPDDPQITHLVATVDVNDSYDVLDLVSDRVTDFLVEGLPIFVIPVRPTERIRAMLTAAQPLEGVVAEELT